MIEEPVTYGLGDAGLVSAYEALDGDGQDGGYWSNEELNGLRSHVKSHYIAAQNTRCCYCNTHLQTEHHRVWDAEHIVPRAKHPRFMFTPRNLAASCLDCNSAKGDTEVLVNPKIKTYPTRSESFKIIHPHFDIFDDHIKYFKFVYLPKTQKGKKTIYVCDLLRFAQKYIDWENSASDLSFEKEVDVVFQEKTTISGIAVGSIVASLPEK